MEKKTKISVENLNLYYGENHALKQLLLSLDHPVAENPHF